MATLTFMTHTIFDHGASKQLAKVLKQQGVQRPLICTDRGLVELGMVAELTGHLGNELATAVFDGTPENPTQAAVQAAVEIYQRAECDGIVAFGGGVCDVRICVRREADGIRPGDPLRDRTRSRAVRPSIRLKIVSCFSRQ